MKNKYLLKSSISNSHRIICQDNSEVLLERIDSVFAKLFCKKARRDNEISGVLSHVKGLNLLSKKSLFANYGNDEAIKKYNQKANVKKHNDIDDVNEIVLEDQRQKAQILYNHLKDKTNIGKYSNTAKQLNKDFFDSMDSMSDFAKHDRIELNNNLAEFKDSISTKDEDGSSYDTFMTLVNPYKLRNYSFKIPEYITLILSITTKSKIFVYCPLDLASPLESSEVNYLFPIVFNTETKFAAQIPLSIMDYPDLNAQKLKDFL